MNEHPLAHLLEPSSIAVIGASRKASSTGARLLQRIGQYPYVGELQLVNPSGEPIGGRPSYRSIRDVPGAVDLALIIVPAPSVEAVVAECAERGVRAAVVFSGGFADDRDPEGKARQSRLADIARAGSIRLLGPNSEGFLNLNTGLAATFSGSVALERVRAQLSTSGIDDAQLQSAADVVRHAAGGTAIVAQSGGLAFSLFGRGLAHGLGFSHVLSCGNEAVVEIQDCIEYLLQDPATSTILLYIEGLGAPERFQQIAARAAQLGKSLVVAKVGRSDAAQRAALSHTGHLAGDDAAYSAVFRRYGVIRVEDPDEMLDVALAIQRCPRPAGDRVGIASFSGGSAVWMSEAVAAAGLTTPELEESTQQRLAALLPSFASTSNPVDISGASSIGPVEALALVADDPGIDSLVLVTTLGSVSLDGELETLTRLKGGDKPVFVYSYTEPTAASRRTLNQLGLPWFTSMHRCARTIAALTHRRSIGTVTAPPPWTPPATPGLALSEHATLRLLSDAGFRVPEHRLVSSPSEAAAAAQRFGCPVALKVQSPEVAHKARVGGVALNVASADDVPAAYDRITRAVSLAQPEARIEGVLVEPMLPAGLELIVGVQTSSGLGPMVLVGIGGALAEAVAKTTLYPAPFDAEVAAILLDDIGAGRILDALHPPAPDLAQVAEFISAVSHLAVRCDPAIVELDINPLIVAPATGAALVCDAFAVVAAAAPEPHAPTPAPAPRS